MSLPDYIPNAKVFMTIKTYPNLSKKYGELVCTAGICNGELIRIYPIRFRNLEEYKQFKKFQWIEVSLRKRNSRDRRLESYSPEGDIKLLEHIPSAKNGWEQRMKIIAPVKLHRNMDLLITQAKQPPFPSLAIVRPKEILDFKIEAVEREWTEEQKAYFNQPDFFHDVGDLTLEKLPYKYSYCFTTEDEKERTLMIEDWEIGALYRNCLALSDRNEIEANQKVRKKYLEMAKNPNLFFFVGTTLAHHFTAPNPFIIIGVVNPKRVDINVTQEELF